MVTKGSGLKEEQMEINSVIMSPQSFENNGLKEVSAYRYSNPEQENNQ
jgi:hypothetical protein